MSIHWIYWRCTLSNWHLWDGKTETRWSTLVHLDTSPLWLLGCDSTWFVRHGQRSHHDRVVWSDNNPASGSIRNTTLLNHIDFCLLQVYQLVVQTSSEQIRGATGAWHHRRKSCAPRRQCHQGWLIQQGTRRSSHERVAAETGSSSIGQSWWLREEEAQQINLSVALQRRLISLLRQESFLHSKSDERIYQLWKQELMRLIITFNS